jgi:hypothetical protein
MPATARLDKKKLTLPLALLALCAILSGCDSVPKMAPKMIVADGTTYFACQELVWIDSTGWGDQTYEVRFTEADGIKRDIRGIKHIEVSDIPPTVLSSLPPYPPDPKTSKDNNGQPYVEAKSIRFRFRMAAKQ